MLEGLNAFATSFFFNYLFFYLRDQLGFSNADNFLITALHGLVYVPASWLAGRFAQRSGYFLSLRLGFAVMTVILVVGAWTAGSVAMQFVVVGLWTAGMAFTWPTLEALVSEKASPSRLPKLIGLYNVIWAGTAALAYFTGGAIVETFGWQTIYWLPALCHLLMIGGATWVAKAYRRAEAMPVAQEAAVIPPPLNPRPIAKARTFLRLAWLANPLAYVAINSLLPVIPKVADTLGLTPMFAGFVCSVWLFARLQAFAILWMWPGWHYKFGWLYGAYLATILSFLAILLIPLLWVVVAAQIIFGLSVGLVYYSSLFYSMDAGEAKGEHGGLHEAAIGAGIFIGPAVGYASLQFFPHFANAGVLAVGILLCSGALILPALRGRRRRK